MEKKLRKTRYVTPTSNCVKCGYLKNLQQRLRIAILQAPWRIVILQAKKIVFTLNVLVPVNEAVMTLLNWWSKKWSNQQVLQGTLWSNTRQLSPTTSFFCCFFFSNVCNNRNNFHFFGRTTLYLLKNSFCFKCWSNFDQFYFYFHPFDYRFALKNDFIIFILSRSSLDDSPTQYQVGKVQISQIK